MHYKNGREAKNGDKVVCVNPYGMAMIGVLYDAVAGNDFCNGKIAPIAPNDPCPNLKECLHLDDVKALLSGTVPDKSAPTPPNTFVANPVTVQAFVITGVGPKGADGVATIFIGDDREKTATPEMMARYTPTIGDYWVIQTDGYEYLNPKDVFERKYSAA